MLGSVEWINDAEAELGTPEQGKALMDFMDASLLSQNVVIPEVFRDYCEEEFESIQKLVRGDMRGLSVQGLDEKTFKALRWVGAPIAVDGTLRWGRDVKVEEFDDWADEEDENILFVPAPEKLATMTSLSVKPIRHYFGSKLGCRLQSATGVGMYLWDNMAVLVSGCVVPIGGFFHGPEKGRRSSLSIGIGAYQSIVWN